MDLVRFASPLAAATLLVGAQGSAQTASAPTATTTTTHAKVATTAKAPTTHAPVQRTAKSLDCSKQADAKNIHGKARKSFMSSCKNA